MGGPLEYKEISNATQKPKYQNIKYFVETGTYKGDTTIMAAEHYDHVYTMEIVPELYEESKKRAEDLGKNNITFLLGDSVKLLNDVVPNVKDGAVFFIDAHQSGPDTSNNGTWVPLMDEIGIILDGKIGPSLYIFDDVRFWVGQDQQAWDWARVSQQGVLQEFLVRGYKVDGCFVNNDRLFVLAECS